MFCSGYVSKLRENLSYIESNYLKKELNIEVEEINKKEKLQEFSPMVIYNSNSVVWMLLEDLQIHINPSNFEGLRKLVDHLEDHIEMKRITIKEALIKKLILDYITRIGI